MEIRFDSGMNRPIRPRAGAVDSGIGQPFEQAMLGDSTEVGGI